MSVVSTTVTSLVLISPHISLVDWLVMDASKFIDIRSPSSFVLQTDQLDSHEIEENGLPKVKQLRAKQHRPSVVVNPLQ